MVSLTQKAKAELVEVAVPLASARWAEMAAMLRMAGRLGVVERRLVVEAEFAERAVADRLAFLLNDAFGVDVDVQTASTSPAKPSSTLVRCDDGAVDVIRRLGLVTRSGTPVVGLPPKVIAGGPLDAEGAWRGAFLARGHLNDPGRPTLLEVSCPGPEAAMAMVGCARRLGITAKTKMSRGVDRTSIKDGDAVAALLTRMGAHRVRLEWDAERLRREARNSENRLANFDDANLRRSARAAVVAAARVERAMDILGDDIPEQLAEAGQLRVTHRQASLEELGRLADPQMTKDAVAGRIRRLLSMADKRAEELGIDSTLTVVADDVDMT
ncbi:DNA-binding protein WhiA [Corynebacterium uterequi]|uniref:Probable cell division protein WhiA n=1 Tax=Corynebacterium uterequi TaxID=1072256 RepID=A0A0G3HEM6_9CORY|nr:DNA-binding protein WhiA [Corynebacterium uterequi]AKK11165.1 hypothetical protein CUTER_05845 [Corynebacterium uterequi]